MFLVLNPPIVIYCRVSSDKQKEQQTVDGQIAALKRHCEHYNVEIIDQYVDDGVTGDLPFLERPGGTRLLQDAQAGRFKTVLVYQYDRFSRDVYEGLTAARLLKAAGASPFSINEQFDIATPHGQYMFVNSLNNAQLFKAQMLERMNDGQRRAAERGQWQGSAAPFGYVLEGQGRTRKLVPDEVTILPGVAMSPADTVRYIFSQIADHQKSLADIATHFDAVGLPPPYALEGRAINSRTGKRRVWTPCTVWTILKNTTYIGIAVYGKKSKRGPITFTVPSLVDDAVFGRAATAMKRNLLGSGRNTHRRYLLRGLMRCAHCGGMYCGMTRDDALHEATGGDRGRYYYCIRTYQRRGNGYEKCTATAVPGIAENMVWNEIVSFFKDPDRIGRYVAQTMEKAVPDDAGSERDLRRLQTALRAKQEERDQFVRELGRGNVRKELLYKQINAADAEEAALLAQIEAVENRKAVQQKAIDAAKDSVSIIADVLKTLETGEDMCLLSFDKKRKIVESLVEGITVETHRDAKGRGEPSLSIAYKFAPPEGTPNKDVPIIYGTFPPH